MGIDIQVRVSCFATWHSVAVNDNFPFPRFWLEHFNFGPRTCVVVSGALFTTFAGGAIKQVEIKVGFGIRHFAYTGTQSGTALGYVHLIDLLLTMSDRLFRLK